MPHDPTEILPDEILLRIFQEVLKENSQQTLLANKRWHQISQDKRLWKKLYGHFIGDPSRISEANSEVDYRKQCLVVLKQYQKLSDNHKLGYSVYHGYDRLLSNFLEKYPNADLHFKSENNEQLIHAIHLATKQGHVNLLDVLLERDPNALNAQDVVGWTPLHYACDNGHISLVAALLTKKVSINLTDSNKSLATGFLIFGETNIAIATEGKEKLPLHIAAEKGNLEIVNLFLKYIGEDKDRVRDILNKQDSLGWTALHYACANGHFEIVKKLIAVGARTDLVTMSGKTILHLACQKNHENIAKYLPTVNQNLVHDKDNVGSSIMHYVCKTGNLSLVIFFAEKYNVPVLQFTNDVGHTPYDLIPSKANNRQEIIKVLEERNEKGYKKFNRIQNSRYRAIVLVIVTFLLALAGAITIPFIQNVSPLLFTILFPIVLAISSVSIGVGGSVLYFRSRDNFRNEVENANRYIEYSVNDSGSEKKLLLENQESEIHHSYATFPKEFSQSDDTNNDYKSLEGAKTLSLENDENLENDDDTFLIDKRKIKKQSEVTANYATQTHDIETGDVEETTSSLSQNSIV